jgi:F420-non-reducing hydrogenase large subunit
VCPWSHHLASAKACDEVFGVTPPPAGVKLRDLCDSIAFTEEHILHFYFLAGPDFVMGPDAPYATRNVIGIAGAEPEIGKKVVRNRFLGAQLLNIISGKAIHPVTAVPGGFSKRLTEAERERCLPMAEEILEFAKWGMAYAKESIFPKYMDAIKTIGIIETGFLGTVTDDGTFDCYDGKLRLMKPDGTFEDFEDKDYLDHIEEKVLPWSYMKFPYAKKWGEGFDINPEAPKGIYRTNTLARMNVVDRMPTPLAQKEFEEFREAFGRPAQQSLLYNYARLIELLCHAEHMVDLLKDPEITSTDTRVEATPRAARGIGHTEAPRGTLIHDYETDDKGLITNCNLIVGTTHNNGAIQMSVEQTAKALIKDGNYDEEILNKVEMAVRAYDPCLSCATHNLDGTIAMELEVRDKDGNLLDNMKN